MTPLPISDESLMREVACGDRKSLETLVRRNANELLAFVERLLGARYLGEEAFQEVIFTVWTKRHQYKYPRPFRPWLYKIALNLCRAELRRTRLSTKPLDDAVATDGLLPSDKVIAIETANAVQSAVHQLPDQQRVVVVLRVWSGMSYSDIGQVMGIAEGTARSYMSHALNSLRTHLQPYRG